MVGSTEVIMAKIDLRKELKEFYNPTAKAVTVVDVPEMSFIMIDGQGAPGSEQFQQSIEALYTVAYTMKFANAAVASGPAVQMITAIVLAVIAYLAARQALAVLYLEIRKQASMLAFLDSFRLVMMLLCLIIPLLLVMKGKKLERN